MRLRAIADMNHNTKAVRLGSYTPTLIQPWSRINVTLGLNISLNGEEN